MTDLARIGIIQKCVAEYYGISPRDMSSHRRARAVCRPRMLAMYLAWDLVDRNYSAIGRAFGRDHTIVMYAVEIVEGLFRQHPELVMAMRELIERIEAETAAAPAVDKTALFSSVMEAAHG